MLDIVHANPQVFGSRDAFHVPAIERTPVLYAVGLTDMTGATVEQRPLAAAKESKNIVSRLAHATQSCQTKTKHDLTNCLYYPLGV